MQTTGPILAVGAITMANRSVLNGHPFEWKIPIATGIAVGMFALAEHLNADIAKGLAWLSLVAVLFVPLDKNIPAPVESLLEWTK